MAWMLRLLFAVLIIRLIWKFIAGMVAGVREAQPRRAKAGGSLVRDPVCGTYVEPARALSTQAGRTTYYFCSRECQQSFVKTT